MKIWKKMAAVLSLMFVFSSFAACGNNTSSGNNDSEVNSSQGSSNDDENNSSTEKPDDGLEAVKQTYNVDANIKLAQTENGVDFQINAILPNLETLIGTMELNALIIDGYAYTLDEGAWIQDSQQMDMGAVASAIEEILAQQVTSSTITLSYKNELNFI